MESISAYFLTTDKAIITKLDQNIEQIELTKIVKFWNKLQIWCAEGLQGVLPKMQINGKGAWPRSRDLLLNFGTPSMYLEWLKLNG